MRLYKELLVGPSIASTGAQNFICCHASVCKFRNNYLFKSIYYCRFKCALNIFLQLSWVSISKLFSHTSVFWSWLNSAFCSVLRICVNLVVRLTSYLAQGYLESIFIKIIFLYCQKHCRMVGSIAIMGKPKTSVTFALIGFVGVIDQRFITCWSRAAQR